MTAPPEHAAADPRQIIADLQRQLDERTAERDEALEQQIATAEVLQVINSSPGDLVPVFDAMLEKATVLCEAAFGILLTHDGTRFRHAALRSIPATYSEFMRQNPPEYGPESGPGRVLAGGGVVHFVDMMDSDLYRAGEPNRRAIVDLAGARTVLLVPLVKEMVVRGIIVAFRQEVRPFSDKQIALLQNFAAQAVIAMENARLITETREALEQQTATAEVLQVINSSPGDLAPVFDAMLDKAIHLCEAAFGTLWTYDGEHFAAVALHRVPQAFAEFLSREPFPTEPGSAHERLTHGERVVQFEDVAAQESIGPARRALVEGGGARSLIAVPLRKDDKLLGVITAYRQEVRPFTDKQIALLENFAAQAVIAMENARLITETRAALEQQTATAEVLQIINSSPSDLAPVFDAMLDKATRLCDLDFSLLYTFDGEAFRAAALHGVPSPFVEYLSGRAIIPRPGGQTGLSQIAAGKDFVHYEDIAAEESYRETPATRAVVELGGARTNLVVALRREGALLGAIVAYRQEVRPFSDKQIALLQNFAAQAVIAMENARLITETREALEQQTATAEVLQVINASPGDLAPVFEAMLEKAMHLCGAAFGTLWNYDGEVFRASTLHRVPKLYADFLRREPIRGAPGTVLGRLAHSERFVHVADVAADEGVRRGVGFSSLIELGGARTVVGVPLRKDESLLGAITVYRQEVRPFSDKQIALLQNFAAQAVIAMENARLITETREALEQQTATAEVLQVINASPGDLAPVFEAILEKAHSLCEAPRGGLILYDGEYVRAVAVRGFSGAFADSLRQGLRGSETYFEAPLLAGERFVHIADQAESEHPNARAGTLAGTRTLLTVPLRKGDALLGVIVAGRTEVRPFTDKQIALLQNFAAQAVIAIENARLLGELRARTEEIAGWNRELEARVAAQLAELERTGKLRRFLAPQLADLIVAQGDESILESHRREIVVVFCDIRGFTGFAERAEPEEVMALLKDYHAALGPIVARFEGTLDHYGGDGVMVFFNDPLPTPDPARRAIDMAVAMREAAQGLLNTWRRHGHDIGFGVGISQGYATLGQIGFAERMDYTAIGTVTNLAARLCSEAKDGQILVSRRVAIAVEDSATLEEIGDLSLKGLSQAVAVYNVVQ